MEPLSLGNIAYNAYCASTNWKSVYTGADLPQYDQQRPEVIQAWENSALAVAATICSAKVAEDQAESAVSNSDSVKAVSFSYGVTDNDSSIPTTDFSSKTETVNTDVDEESAPDETYAIKA